ncbi:MAG: tyrosine-type recombinase/integrase [Eubacteriales bacterium]|nr:tyrosine-type recombinase/integrase [Eubacteriales bacterium]
MLFLTETEISDFLHFLSETYPRLLSIAFMGAYYGLRRSEILGLKWSAINFKRKIISIRHTVVRVKTTQAANSTKTISGKRDLNLFDTAEKYLLKVKEEQDANKAFFKGDYKNEDATFLLGKTARPIIPTTYLPPFAKQQKHLDDRRSRYTSCVIPTLLFFCCFSAF